MTTIHHQSRTTRVHRMAFGAEYTAEGTAFRLWAPDARTVDLVLEKAANERSILPMTGDQAGWFRYRGPAPPGTPYRFRIDKDLLVPDPVSRRQLADVHGPSVVVDPLAFVWEDGGWQGRPWEEAVLYELHVGTFTPEGTFAALIDRLDYLVELGVTAIELMPVAHFPGKRNWGYDGVLLFAPDRSYGTPEELKQLVQAAHARGLMLLLDVVYNHFGPEGNYLHVYARQAFFDEKLPTPWGAGLRFSGPLSGPVRRFFIDNALYWLEEYHLDGLRFDAVHAIHDSSEPDILTEIAAAVRDGPGRERAIHLILENDANQARYLERDGDGVCTGYAAQWNDDFHHTVHVLLTGEQSGYYRDYARTPIRHLGRCLSEGFAYQGESSLYRHAFRGERCGHLPLTAFVTFLQNHDQTGNRALGERLHHLIPAPLHHLAAALFLLAPSPPLLFMGEEFASSSPFLYFCDFSPELAPLVASGRREEFSRFPAFRDPIPDPGSPETFRRSRLNWPESEQGQGAACLRLYRHLLALRHREIIPRLAGLRPAAARAVPLGEEALQVGWILGDGSRLELLVNFSDSVVAAPAHPARSRGRVLFTLPDLAGEALGRLALMPHSIVWLLEATEVNGHRA